MDDRADLLKELYWQFISAHSDHCRSQWPHLGRCMWRVPEALENFDPEAVDTEAHYRRSIGLR